MPFRPREGGVIDTLFGGPERRAKAAQEQLDAQPAPTTPTAPETPAQPARRGMTQDEENAWYARNGW